MTVWSLIDWRQLGFNALWILALGLLVAVLSWACYRAADARSSVLATLKQPRYQLALNGSLVLFCAGLLGVARTWWEGALWLVLGAVGTYRAWQGWKSRG